MQSRDYPVNAIGGDDVFPTTDGTYYIYTTALDASRGVLALECEEKP